MTSKIQIINEELEKNLLFTRRAFMIAGGKFGLLSLLLARLYYMEVIKSEEYRILSDKNHINLIMLPPSRGKILDRKARKVAINKTNYRIMLDKKESKYYQNAVVQLCELLHFQDVENLLAKIQKTSARLPIQIFDNLSWHEVALVEENILNLPGIFIERGQVRYYPYRAITSHLIGHTGILNLVEKEEYELENIGDFHLGKRSLEKYYNTDLMGKFGIKKMEVNAHGLYIREIDVIPEVPGQDMQLSIDIDLQAFIAEKLNYKGSAAVVMDVRNGKILAMLSEPGFDPNLFTTGISQRDWDKLLKDENKPLINKAINGCYPPGSPFKLIVMLAALESGVDASYKVNCHGSVMIGSRKFRCASQRSHGILDMRSAIQKSCNCYIHNIAKLIGIEKIFNMAERLGIGRLTGVDFPDETSGFLPTRRWKKKKFGDEWSFGDTINTAIGQGYLLSTPLQMVSYISAIANGGILYQPSFLDNRVTESSVLGVSQKNLSVIRDGMYMAANIPGGTAYRSRSFEPGFEIAGKTGTAQVIGKKFDNHNLSSHNIAWHKRNHGIFVGFGPFNDPKYACAVVVEHGGDGSALAAPLGSQILIHTNRIFNE